MKCHSARVTVLATLALTLLVSAAGAQTHEPLWPTYHMDEGRRGQNSEVTTGNPASIGPIWAFPRDLASSVPEGDTINDAPQQKNFRTGLVATDHYGGDFYYKTVISRDEKDSQGNQRTADAWAWWDFPATLPKGVYQIMIWVPATYKNSDYTNTSQAEYTVYDDNGQTTVKFDQRNGGGWVYLSSRYFSFTNPGGPSGYKVELSNLTDDDYEDIVDDPDSKNPRRTVIVAADAIRFIPGTGREIYTSPVSAKINWTKTGITYTDPEPPAFVPAGGEKWTGDFTGDIPVVYIGTVESPVGGGAPETGSVFCINSITEYNRKITDESWHTNAAQYEDWKRANALAQFLGTTIWQYPRPFDARTDELEGPIEGGIYATPTLVSTGDATHPLICVVAAMDRQVYSIDAKTGELLWKGPGVTRSEGNLAANGWVAQPADAFGGKYHYVACQSDDTNARTVEWTFDDDVRKAAGEPSGDLGWAYSVYVWLPAVQPAETPRTTKAGYTITYTGPDGKPATTKISVDQSNADNQGKWVRLGSSFFNVSKVSLDNVKAPSVPAIPNEPAASTYHVVADAVMIVPDTIDSFSYSTPVWNGKTDAGARIFAASVSGRVLGFTPVQEGDHAYKAGTVKWIFPEVRTKRQPGGEADMDKTPFGQIAASPSFAPGSGGPDRLFVADFDGKLHCISNMDANTPVEAWTFPPADSSEEPEHFTSSPAYDNVQPQVLIGGTNGAFYSIDAGTGALNWKYPADPVNATDPEGIPLGAFRYSTAAIGDDPSTGLHRAWVGSSDGRIYSFDITMPSDKTRERRIYAEWDDDGNHMGNHVKYYVEPNALAPIQGSVALDKTTASGHPYMFVGDMADRGSLHWYRADSGVSDFYVTEDGEQKFYKSYRLEGMLFSSPSISQASVPNVADLVSYIYIGCSDGRLFAFSDDKGAWGGGWSGGEWPYGSDENPEDRREEQLAPDTDIQFEMITREMYQNSLNRVTTDFEPTIVSGGVTYYTMPSPWIDDWIVSQKMKQPTIDLSSATDKAIDDELRTQAKERRMSSNNTVFALNERLRPSSSSDSTVYFEWGEKMYLALWNLPPKKFLYGFGSGDATVKANIRFNLTNSSPGASAGSTSKPTVTITKLEDYTVLNKTLVNSPVPHYDVLKYNSATKGNVMRSFALAEVEFRANVPRPPSPGPGWVLTVEIRKKESTSATAPVTTMTIPVARLKAGSPPEPLWIQHQTTDATITDPTKIGAFKEQLLGVNNPLAIRDDNEGNFLSVDTDGVAWENDYKAGANDQPVPNKGRYHPEAHFNGNSAYVVDVNNIVQGYTRGKLPTMNLDNFRGTIDLGVAHGTNSREGRLGIMDRSALGLSGAKIDNFRIDAGDLVWQGGEDAITNSLRVGAIGRGVKFDWEFGLGSADYPDIPKRRGTYRKAYDERDPSKAQSTLPGVVAVAGAPYDAATMRPDTVYMSVDVPKYQPANVTIDSSAATGRDARFGYQKTMTAYVDSDRTGTWNSGDQVLGRPVTYQEAYRRFKVGLRVPADPRIQVEEQLVDIGQAAHGLGEGLAGSPNPWDKYEFVPVNPLPEVQQWFKKITIKNAGNVNLYNLRVAKNVPLLMVKDAASMLTPDSLAQSIPGVQITSSLDNDAPLLPYLQPLKADPFTTSNLYTVTKPRVGDPDPSILTIPDKRKWDNNYNDTATDATAALTTALVNAGKTPAEAAAEARALLPYATQISVRIPVSQPLGTYQAPYVPIWADLDGNGTLTLNTDGSPAEPFAAPTFQLKATVRESVMTGVRDSGCLPQVELPMNTGFYPRVGDSTPAAYRDSKTGNVRLLWSSNRMFTDGLYPDWNNPNDPARKDFANAPWLLDQAELRWHNQQRAWVSSGVRWWEVPARNDSPYVPFFTDTNSQWPPLLPIWDTTANAEVMPWEFSGDGTGFVSVRHYSPAFGVNPDVDPRSDDNRNFLIWCGTANVKYDENTDNGPVTKVDREHSLFYVDATCPGEDDNNSPVISGHIKNEEVTFQRIPSDPKSEKRHPSIAVYEPMSWSQTDARMWAVWQGADTDRWSLYYGVNDKANFPSDGWNVTDAKLATPICLSTAGSPNVVHRVVGDKIGGANSKHLLDVVYDASTKLRQTSDVLLSRYTAVTESDIKNAKADGISLNSILQPSRVAQPMPRIYGERLERDPKYGFFTSQHLAWVRPNSQGLGKLGYFTAADSDAMLADHVGQKAHDAFTRNYDKILDGVAANSRAGLYEFYNMPHIWVVLPDDYEAGDKVFSDGDIVSATDGIVPEIDAATSTVIYKYPKGSDAEKVFGETIADFSAGIIRFKNPLSEKKATDGSVLVPHVYADYTPQTWRVTTDPAVDNSPRSFIDKTPMTKPFHPGMSDFTGDPPPVDRLWVLWRKAGSGVNSSTIFWKTYRIGVDLTKLVDTGGDPAKPVKWKTMPDGSVALDSVTVTNALGAWEVDRTGTRVYFTERDERYSSMLQNAGRNYYDVNANTSFLDDLNSDGIKDIVPITINYRNKDNQMQTVKVTEVSWIPESAERSLFGYASDSSVNEGSIYAFADIANPPLPNGTPDPILSSKIWVFWTSTRQGTSDLCWATLSPNFAAR